MLLDPVGLGAPLWAATGWAIDLLLGLRALGRRHQGRGRDACRPCRAGRSRRWSSAGCGCACGRSAGALARAWSRSRSARPGAALAPVPDLLVTGDGRHLAIVGADGAPVLLRDRSGDFMRSLMSEAAGYDGEPLAPRGAALRPLQPRRLRRRHRPRRPSLACCSPPARRDRIDWRELIARLRATPTSSSPTAGCRAAARRAGSSSTALRWRERRAGDLSRRRARASTRVADAARRSIPWRSVAGFSR